MFKYVVVCIHFQNMNLYKTRFKIISESEIVTAGKVTGGKRQKATDQQRRAHVNKKNQLGTRPWNRHTKKER